MGELLAGFVAWNENVEGKPVPRAMPQSFAVLPPALMIVANTVAGVPTWTDRLRGSTAAARGPAPVGGPCTWTANDPLLVDHWNPSTVPRNRRVAPAGTTNSWGVPEPRPVSPSPMKNTCFSAGDRLAKAIPRPLGSKL